MAEAKIELVNHSAEPRHYASSSSLIGSMIVVV